MQPAAEFFAGIGLVRMALERCGWRVTFANDIDPNKFQIYEANFGSDHFHLQDVHKLTPKAIPEVSLATASFPCVDLSLAGNRDGLDGSESAAYWGFHRLLKRTTSRPRYVLLENVTGLLVSNSGHDLRRVIVSLNELGYGCDLLLVDAVHFVPQSRPRLFIVGRLNGTRSNIRDFPQHEARPKRVLDFIEKNADLKWTHCRPTILPTKRSDLDQLMERFELDSPLWWSKERRAHLYSQMSPRHKKVLRFLASQPHASFATVYKRVRPRGCSAEVRADGIAGCLRTPRGGSSKQFVIQAGFGDWRVRNMTAREYARLQGVPDTFRIDVPYNQALFGFGDAVCVPAVEWVIKNAVQARL